MRGIIGVFVGVLVLGLGMSGCSEGSSGDDRGGEVSEVNGSQRVSEPTTGPGGMVLPEGYTHAFTGDSTSYSGRISKSPTPTIVYSIGAKTGNFVHELATGQDLTPEVREDGDQKYYILRQQGMLYITVTSDGAGMESVDYPANFQGPVSDEDVDEVINMVMTYNP